MTAIRHHEGSTVPDLDDRTDTDQGEEPVQVKPFATFLQEQRRGLLHNELSEMLAAVAVAVREHKKTGTLTLTITIAPAEFAGAVKVGDKVAVKLPEADRDAGLFYPNATGFLSRSDPRQPELPHIREAGRTPASQTARSAS